MGEPVLLEAVRTPVRTRRRRFREVRPDALLAHALRASSDVPGSTPSRSKTS
jgi:acetyl-CoA acetyltransferase